MRDIPVYFGDPSLICDRLRKVEREMKMKNCGTCRHQIDGWGMTGCEDGHTPDESGRCREWVKRQEGAA